MAWLDQFLVDGFEGHVDDGDSSELETNSGVAHLTVQGIDSRLVGVIGGRWSSRNIAIVQCGALTSRHMKLWNGRLMFSTTNE